MKFLDIPNLPKLSQNEINNSNRSTTLSGTEAINKILTSKPQTNQPINQPIQQPKNKKTQSQIDSMQNSIRLSKSTLLHNIDTEKTLPNYFMKFLLS